MIEWNCLIPQVNKLRKHLHLFETANMEAYDRQLDNNYFVFINKL